MEIETMTTLVRPHFPRTPSLTSSSGTSASSDFDLPLRKALRVLPINGKKPPLKPLGLAQESDRRSRTLSGFIAPPSRSLRTFVPALKNPRVLARCLSYLSWVDFHTLACTCRDLRNILRDLSLRDVVLAQYVPGYRHARENRDVQRFRDVPITIQHLDLLFISQHMPLHQYPVHALDCMSATRYMPEREEFTKRLELLTQVHSRFVLLLQSLVHSSSLPVSEEPEEQQPHSRLGKGGLRELTFPAPLSLSFDVEKTAVPEINSISAPRRGHKRHSSHSSQLSGPSSPASYKQPTKLRFTILPRRMSILFRAGPKAPPPPAAVPRSIQVYSATWRRHQSTPRATYGSDDDSPLERPHRRFASMNGSRTSSLSSSPASPLPSPTIIRTSSPHDLQMAMSRTRAPVLRVFVPCVEMGESAIAACEEQLIDSGLWGHLSTGDIVCNLGFVPEPGSGSGSSGSSFSDSSDSERDRQWLLFNGHALVPFSPPSSPPLDDPLTLPSPFYYSHILSPFTNQTFNITLPPSDFEEAPQLTLVHSTSKVPSPHSPAGYASVKKYMWVARVTRLARTQFSEFGEGEAIGQGWKGEWVLEGEGTSEGRQVLVDCIRGCETEKREWEFVREKSGGGRIWIKLLNATQAHTASSTTTPKNSV